MADPILFGYIGDTVQNATNVFVVPAAANLMFKLQMLALTGVTLYIAMTGYAIATGSVESPFWAFAKQCMKIIIIAVFALTADGYQNQVVEAFRGLEAGLSDALNANSASPASSIYETLDSLLKKGWDVTARCMENSNGAGWHIGSALGWFAAGLMALLGTLLLALIGGITIIVAKFSLAILFALGPLFILSLMFPATAKFFDSWFSQVLNYTFTIVVVAMIMAFGVVAFDSFVSGANLGANTNQNPLVIGAQILGLTVGLGWIAYQGGGIAAGLAGGVSMAALSLRQVVMPAAIARNVIDPVRTRRDLESGQMVTARRANHMVAGNTLWNPAYKQHVLENIGKNWSRAKGGTVKEG